MEVKKLPVLIKRKLTNEQLIDKTRHLLLRTEAFKLFLCQKRSL
jgi:hypothetical protein